MAINSSNINVRVNPELKKEADAVFSSLGLTLSSAINIFLMKAVQEQGIPFDVTFKPNKETIEAMKESERIAHDPTVKGYTDVDEMFRDILS